MAYCHDASLLTVFIFLFIRAEFATERSTAEKYDLLKQASQMGCRNSEHSTTLEKNLQAGNYLVDNF